VRCLAYDNTQSGSPVSTQYFDQGVIISGTPYAYTAENPISHSDPTGLFLWPWESAVTVIGDNSAQVIKVAIATDRVLNTARGQELLKQITGPWYWHGNPKTLHVNCDKNDSGEVGGSNFWVDPNREVILEMDIGPTPASLERVIAHELGHTLGTADDGPGNMNNVNLNENPISTQLGEPYHRIRY
jgi:hypothetical protein